MLNHRWMISVKTSCRHLWKRIENSSLEFCLPTLALWCKKLSDISYEWRLIWLHVKSSLSLVSIPLCFHCLDFAIHSSSLLSLFLNGKDYSFLLLQLQFLHQQNIYSVVVGNRTPGKRYLIHTCSRTRADVFSYRFVFSLILSSSFSSLFLKLS